MNLAILSILSQKKSSHGNLRIRNFPVVGKKIYGSVSEAGELGLYVYVPLPSKHILKL